MQLAPHLHRLGTSSLVNSYLVEEGGRVTVIDAGLPGLWKDLAPELDAMGRSLDDVAAVLLTHGDVDHVGFAERLRRDHGVPVWVNGPDAAEARGEAKKPSAARDPMRIGPMIRFLAYAATHGGLRSTPVAEVSTLTPGTVARGARVAASHRAAGPHPGLGRVPRPGWSMPSSSATR